MTDLIDLLRKGSFGGVPFLVISATTTGGRKKVKHQFPNSKKQSIEDLGFMPKSFQLVVETVQSFTQSGSELNAQSYFDNIMYSNNIFYNLY